MKKTKFFGEETTYNSTTFKSKLESLWAEYFDTLDIRWKYEPERFLLDHGRHYTPDFYIEDGYVEVKPKWSMVNLERMMAFVNKGHNLYICVGKPEENNVFYWSTIHVISGYWAASFLSRSPKILSSSLVRETSSKLTPIIDVRGAD